MLSISHILIIFIVALIVFGPEKLPELARNLGKITADFRRASMSFRQALEENMRQLEREVEESRAPTSAPAAAALPAGEPVPASPGSSPRAETPGEEPAAVTEVAKPAENPPDGNPSPA